MKIFPFKTAKLIIQICSYLEEITISHKKFMIIIHLNLILSLLILLCLTQYLKTIMIINSKIVYSKYMDKFILRIFLLNRQILQIPIYFQIIILIMIKAT